MTAAAGVASSVTTFIGNIVAFINYSNDVYDTSTEISPFLRELKHLRIYLFALDKLFFAMNRKRPWLKTLKELDVNPPDSIFKEVMKLLKELIKSCALRCQWKIVKKRLLWTLAKTSVRAYERGGGSERN